MNVITDATIRPYQKGDEAAAYFVCLKTGDHGQDGEPYYSHDPDALGRLYVGPYLALAPEFAFVLEDVSGVCGYALGALDSKAFYERYDQEWRPILCAQFREPEGNPAHWTRTEQVHHLYHHPDYFCPEPYELYPSHVHIDLLHRAQARGHGREMMECLLSRLGDAGSPGVHLGMSVFNTRARAFYQKFGFRELARCGEGDQASIYLGLRLD